MLDKILIKWYNPSKERYMSYAIYHAPAVSAAVVTFVGCRLMEQDIVVSVLAGLLVNLVSLILNKAITGGLRRESRLKGKPSDKQSADDRIFFSKIIQPMHERVLRVRATSAYILSVDKAMEYCAQINEESIIPASARTYLAYYRKSSDTYEKVSLFRLFRNEVEQMHTEQKRGGNINRFWAVRSSSARVFKPLYFWAIRLAVITIVWYLPLLGTMFFAKDYEVYAQYMLAIVIAEPIIDWIRISKTYPSALRIRKAQTENSKSD